MDEQKALIAEIEKAIADLEAKAKADGVTLDELKALAKEKLELKTKLGAERDELVSLEAAFAEPEAEAEGEEAEEEVAGEGEEETPAEVPAEVEAPAETPAEIEVPAEVEAPADGGEAAGDTVEETNEQVALAASASETDALGGSEDAPKTPYVLTASASVGTVNTGAVMGMDEALQVLQASMRGQTEGKQRMFTVNRFPEGTPVVGPSNSAIENSRIMAQAARDNQQPVALTAAACFCGPDQILPDFDALGSRLRPVAGIFNSVPINGGFEYFKDIAINPDSGSVNIWTCDDQDLVDPDDTDTWKQCSELDCFTSESAYPYAIVGCTIVSTFHNWAHPEQVRTWLDKLQIEYARKAEQALLNIIDANAGTPLTVGASAGAGVADYGIKAQLVYALGNLAFPLAYQFRSEGLEGHVAIIERGLIDAMLADEKLRGFAPDSYTRQQIISDVFGAFGIRVVERLDEPTGGTPAMGGGTATNLATAAQATVTALNAGGEIDETGSEPTRTPLQPAKYRIYVLRPDQFIHAEGQLVGADWYTDTSLLRQNKKLYFWENLELLEWSGLEKVYAIDVYGFINGARADLVWPFGATVPDPS